MYKAIVYLTLIAASSAQFLPNGCPSNNGVHLLLPHETDCAKFYSCSNGNKIEMNCAPGTLFDANLQVCNWPFAVHCTTPSPQETTTTPVPTTTTPATTTTAGPIVLLPNGCPADFTVPSLLPHPTDCSKYYQCSNGNAVEMPCGDGTLFDFELQTCNWPWMVICYPGATTPLPTTPTTSTTQAPTTTTTEEPTTTTTTEAPTTTTEAPTTTTEAPTTTTTEEPTTTTIDPSITTTTTDDSLTTTESSIEFLPNGCPANFSEHRLLPHETDCAKFYSCGNGQKFLMHCSLGTLFSFEAQRCDWPHLVDCTPGATIPSTTSTTTVEPTTTTTEALTTTSTTEEPTTTTTEEPTTTTTTTTEAPTTTTTEEPTTTTTTTTTEAPTTTTTEEPTTTTTTTTTEAPTTTTTEEPTTTTTTATTEAPTTTTTEEPTTTTTTTTTEAPTTTTTEEPTTTTTTTTTEAPTTTTTEEPTTTTTTTTTEAPTTTTTTQEPTTTTTETPITTTVAPGFLPNGCPEDFSNYLLLPHESDCGKFYSCVNGNKVEMNCPSGTWFDFNLQLCSWPFMVQCNVTTTTPVPTTTTAEEPTTTEVSTTPEVPTASTDPTSSTSEETTSSPEYTRTTIDEDTTFEPTTQESSTTEQTDLPPVADPTTQTPSTEETTTTTDYATEEDSPTTEDSTTQDYDSTTSEYDSTTDDYSSTGDDGTTTELTDYPADSTTVTTEEPSTEDDNPCPLGTYGNVPHPELCNSFYLCVSGVAVSLQCAAGFEFDPELKTCVAIAPGGCTLGQSTTSSTEIYPTVETTTDDDMSSSTTEGVPDLCPEGIWGNIPHEYRCDSFYMCAAGNAIPLYCSDGFEFDPVTSACVLIAEGGCTYNSTTTTPEPTTEDPISAICPPGTWGNVPHPEICNSFYMCAGTPIQLFCSEGFEFDPITRQCVAIAEGGCTYNQGTTTDNGETTTISTTLGESDTTKITSTVEGSETTTVEAASGELETTTGLPITDNEGDSSEESFDACPLGVFGNVPHPDLCNVYYLCLSGNEPIELTCPDGLEFDPETRQCVLIAEGGCTLGTQTTTTPVPTIPSNLETTTTTATTPPPICPLGVHGNVPHPELCHSFYMCAGGTAIQLFCSEGFEFDPEIRSCVRITEGGCSLGATTTTEAPPPIPICPPGIWGNVPHPDMCDSFYMCVGGTAIQLNCSAGFEFDPEIKNCVAIAEGGCTLGSQTTPAIETTTGSPNESTELTTEGGTSSTEDDYEVTTVRGSDEESEESTTESSEDNQTTAADYTETDSTTETSTDETTVSPDQTTEVSEEITDSIDETTESSAQTTEVSEETTEPTDETTESPDQTTEVSEETTDSIDEITESPAQTTEVSEETTESTDETTESPDQTTEVSEETTDSTDEITESPAQTTEVSEETTDSTDEITESPGQTTEVSEETTKPTDETTESPAQTTEVSEETTDSTDEITESPAQTTEVSEETTEPTDETTESPDQTTEASEETTDSNNETTESPAQTTEVSEETTESSDETTESPAQTTEVSEETTGSPNETTESPDQTTEVSDSTDETTESPDQTTEVSEETTGSTDETTESPDKTTEVSGETTGSSNESTEPSTTESSEITETPTTEISETTTSAPICPAGVFGNVPHPTVCNSFYLCSGGVSILLQCSAGYEYDPEVRTCVVIAEGGCTLGPISSTTSEPIETTTESGELICPPGWFGNIAHPEKCNSFYMCLAGELIMHTCIDGYEFDTVTWGCVVIADGGCTLGPNTGTPEDEDPTPAPVVPTSAPDSDEVSTPQAVCPPGVYGNVPHPNRCDAYYMCAADRAILIFCNYGQEFNHETQGCVLITEGGCTLGPNTGTTPDDDEANVPHPQPESTETTSESNETTPDSEETTPESIETTPDSEETTPESIETTPDSEETTPESIETTPDSEETTPESIETTPDSKETTAESAEVTTPAPICPPGVFGNVAHPDKCDSFFICTGAQAIERQCAEGQEFEPLVQNCVLITEGGCTLGQGNQTSGEDSGSSESEITTPTSDPTPEVTTTSEPEDTTTEATQTTLDSAEATTPVPICPPGVFGNVAHPDKCDSFFICTGAQAIERQCAEGQEFEPLVANCVLITEGGCTLGQGNQTSGEDSGSSESEITFPTSDPTPEVTTTSEPEDTTSEATQTTLESAEATTPPPICPPGVFGNVAHPDKCDTFFICTGALAIERQCADGQEFEPLVQNCVLIAEGGCTLGQGNQSPGDDSGSSESEITTPTPNTTPEVTTTSEPADTTSEAAQPTSEATQTTLESAEVTTPAPICPPGVFGNVAHPDKCDSFFICTGALAIERQCAEGQEFEPLVANCVLITEGGCTLGQGNQTSEEDSGSSESEITTPTSDPTSEVTTTSKPVDTTSEAAQTTSEATHTTLESAEVTTPAPICPPGVFGNIAHPDKCDTFFICTGAQAIERQCAEGQEFEPLVANCVLITEGGCTLGQGNQTSGEDTGSSELEITTTSDPTPEVTTTSEPEDTTSEAAQTTSEATQTTLESAEATTPVPICPPGVFGNVAHPDKCDTFFICTGAQAIERQCAEGQEFEPLVANCVLITEGGCTLGQGNQTSGEDSGSSESEITTPTSDPTPEVTTTSKPVDTTSEAAQTTLESAEVTTLAPICPPGVFGNVAHPDKCDTFFICTGAQVIERQCAEGQEFEPLVQNCVLIAEGGCTLGQGNQSPGDDSGSSESEITTPTPNTTADVTTTSELADTTSEAAQTTSEATQTTLESAEVTTPAPVCPPGVFGNVAHPDKCDSFFICTGALAIERQCAEGQEFEPLVANCVLIAEGGCTLGQGNHLPGDDSGSSESEITTPTPNTTPEVTTTSEPADTTSEAAKTTSEATQTTLESAAVAPICPPGVFGNVAHPDKCDTFFICTGAQAIERQCAEGQEFEPLVANCVLIAEGGCTLGQGNQLPGDDSGSSESEITTPTPNTTPEVTTTSELADTTSEAAQTTSEATQTTLDSAEVTTPAPICPPGVFGNVAHPDKCDSFFICTGALAIEQQCAEGHEFNPAVANCVLIAEGGCTLGQNTATTPKDTDDELNSVEDITTTDSPNPTPGPANPEEPNPKPDSSEETDTTTPVPETTATVPDDTETVTTTTESSTSTEPESTPSTEKAEVTTPIPICPSGVFGNVPNPDNCQAFYMCTNGMGIPLMCSEGFEFDPESRTCIEVAEGGCTLGQNTGNDEDANATPEEYVTSEPVTTTAEPVEATTASVTPPPICAVGQFGNIAHPESCASFYMCTSGNAILLQCSEGFEFSTEIGNCIQIAEGGCTLGGILPTEEPTIFAPEDNKDAALFECPHNQFGNVGDPARCDAFYDCSGNTPLHLLCADGYEFDSKSRMCIEIAPGGCTLSNPETTSTAASTTVPTTVAGDMTSATICPESVVGNLPDEQDCTSFYRCMDGHALKLYCATGYEFDPELDRCVQIAEEGCTLGSIVTTNSQSPTKTSEQTTEATTKPTTEATTTTESTTTSTTETPTTTESTTTEPTTTGAPTTTEPTTTEPTTTKLTTIAAPTLTEPTTTEPTTTEPTTTAAPTTPEPTITELTITEPTIRAAPTMSDPTTKKPTTTEPKTTTAPTTTESTTTEPTITEHTTTAAPISTEPTTTEPTTIAAPTTTEPTTIEPKITEPTTTAAPTSTEPITTEPTTTSAPTTTEPTTTEPTITEPTTTAAPTTTEPTTTEPTTTTAPTTTEPIITEPTTTSAPTTTEPTTTEPTITEPTTTAAPTTTEPITTEPTTTSAPTTTEPTTTEPTITAAPTTTEPTTTEPIITEPTTTAAPTTTEPTTTESTTTTAPTTTEPITTEPTTTSAPTTTEPTTTEPTMTEPTTTAAPTTTEPITTEPTTTSAPTTTEPTTTEPTIIEPTTTAALTTTEPTTTEPTTTAAPTTTEPTTTEPTTTEPTTTAAPTTTELTTTEPPTTAAPTATGPTTAEPTATEPTTTAVPTTTQPTTTEGPTTTVEAPTTAAPLCSPGMFGNVPDLNSCEFFYRCIGAGNPLYLRCPAGFEYEHSVANCVPIAEGGCTLGTTEQKVLPTPTEETNTTFIELETNSTSDHVSEENKSPSIELDESFEALIKSQIEADEEKKRLGDIACPSGVYGNMPDPQSCHSYYYCAGGLATQLHCSEGFEFDPDMKSCVHTTKSKCKSINKEKTL